MEGDFASITVFGFRVWGLALCSPPHLLELLPVEVAVLAVGGVEQEDHAAGAQAAL